MRRSVHATLGNPESAGLIRQGDPSYLAALRKIHDRESVEVGKLDEDTTRGPVGICFESHGAHWVIEIQFPCDLIGLKIDHCGRLAFQGPADRISTVRRDVNIMDAIDLNALDADERDCVNHIERALRRTDTYENLAAIFGDGDVVRPAAEALYGESHRSSDPRRRARSLIRC